MFTRELRIEDDASERNTALKKEGVSFIKSIIYSSMALIRRTP